MRPAEYDVIATPNLNGDYISDALAAQVGGIGIAPGANMSDEIAMFEATHGTAPKYAGQDKVESRLADPLRRDDAAAPGLARGRRPDRLSMEATIGDKVVTYDFARLLDDATEVSSSAFGRAMVERM